MKDKRIVAILGDNQLARELHGEFVKNKQVKVLDKVEASADADIDVVIETNNLNIHEKEQQLQSIETVVKKDTLILTTVLGVTTTEAASWLQHSNRVIGFATFANLSQTQLIEIAPALQSDEDYLAEANQVFNFIGKDTGVVEDEVGLVFPRVLTMIINEAIFAVMEKIATVEDIDEAMKKGTNYPLGPLHWADEIGLEDILSVLSGLHRNLGEERYRPAPLLRKMVLAGWNGKRAGKGFYAYRQEMEKETIG